MFEWLNKRKQVKPDEEIRRERAELLDKMIQDSAKVAKLIKAEGTGWKEYVGLLDDYIDKCQKRKLAVSLDRADEQTLYELKLLDHEVFILRWLKQIPEQFIMRTERMVKDNQAIEDSKNVEATV